MSKNKKIAIVISSFSAMLEDEIKQYEDIYLTPLQLFIGSNHWFEGFYSNEEKYKIVEMFKESNDFKTSLAPVVMVEEQMKELASKYDQVIYMPINSYLSSSCDSITIAAKAYNNVQVVNNKLVGKAYLFCALEAKRLFEEEGYDIDKVIEFIKWYDQRTIGYILPFELKTFIKSGRLKGIKKAIMTSLNFSTIVEFDYVLSSVGIAKSKKSGASKIISKLQEFVEKSKMKIEQFEVSTIYAFDKLITNTLTETFEKHFNKKVDLSYEASLSTMFHTGWGAGYIGINPNIKFSPFKKENK